MSPASAGLSLARETQARLAWSLIAPAAAHPVDENPDPDQHHGPGREAQDGLPCQAGWDRRVRGHAQVASATPNGRWHVGCPLRSFRLKALYDGRR